MKSLKFLTVMIAGLFVMASCNTSNNQRAAEISEKLQPGEKPENAVVMSIDPVNSSVAWEGSNLRGSHNGTIDLAAGEMYIIDNQLVGGNIVMDMSRIVVLDIENPAMNERLTNHLKSDDFFSVETYPEALFQMANIRQIEDAAPGEPNYLISGNMTIKGITHGVSFPAFVEITDDMLRANADFDLDRSQWDVRFGSGKFFENLGDRIINDNFNLKLDITASRNVAGA
jgi:polyisoprenoid-binding protein YceI